MLILRTLLFGLALLVFTPCGAVADVAVEIIDASGDGAGNPLDNPRGLGIDGAGNMVDLRSGYRVLDASGSPFSIDTTAVLPPSATTSMSFSGNLPAVKTGPLAEELSGSSALNEGTQATLTGVSSAGFTYPWSREPAGSL